MNLILRLECRMVIGEQEIISQTLYIIRITSKKLFLIEVFDDRRNSIISYDHYLYM
jgi:hypothetical protein